MAQIKINNGSRRVEISGVEIQNELVFDYFSNLPESDRDATFQRALHIGVLALNQDRIAAFLSKTETSSAPNWKR